jgi:hypothetical protein
MGGCSFGGTQWGPLSCAPRFVLTSDPVVALLPINDGSTLRRKGCRNHATGNDPREPLSRGSPTRGRCTSAPATRSPAPARTTPRLSRRHEPPARVAPLPADRPTCERAGRRLAGPGCPAGAGGGLTRDMTSLIGAGQSHRARTGGTSTLHINIKQAGAADRNGPASSPDASMHGLPVRCNPTTPRCRLLARQVHGTRYRSTRRPAQRVSEQEFGTQEQIQSRRSIAGERAGEP